MKKYFFAFCLCLAPTTRAWSAFGANDTGTSSAQFLEWSPGARAEGLGEAFTAVADDASALYWNPAGLSRIEAHSATLMHAMLLGGINYDYAAYGLKSDRLGAFAGSVQYVSQPTITETDASGFATGNDFSPHSMALSLGYSFTFPEANGAAIGLAGKYIESKISNSASTFAGDIGLLGPAIAVSDARMRFAAVVQNMGAGLKYQATSDPLPLAAKLGAAGTWGKFWLFSLDVAAPRDHSPYVALGNEYRCVMGPRMDVVGRIGFNSRTLGDVGGFSGLTTGVGGRFGAFSADYAFAPMGALGLTHRLSLTITY